MIDNPVEVQAAQEAAEMTMLEKPTVASLVEQLSAVDKFIYSTRKQVHMLSMKDPTSVAYQFSAGLLEMLSNMRRAIIGEFSVAFLCDYPTEKIGVIFEAIVTD